MHMLSKKNWSSEETGDSVEVQDAHNGVNRQWRSADKRGSTGMCLRSWALRNSAMTRRHACSSITWKPLQRTRIFRMSGTAVKKPHPTKQRKNIFLQDWKFHTSCCPWNVVQFWYQFRLLRRYHRTHQVHLQVQQESVVTIGHRETVAIHQKPETKFKRSIEPPPFARSTRMVRRVRRKSRRYRSACTRTHFSNSQVF